MDFLDSMRGVSKAISQKRKFATDEAKTRSYLVDPFIGALGYQPGNPNHVTPEFTSGFVGKNKKVDYALNKDGKPAIFVEVKSATKDLSHQHTEQLQIYFSTKLSVRFGILTNGLEYRFYSDLENQNVMDDAPFLTVDLLMLNETIAANLSVFTESSFDLERAKLHALGLKYKLSLRSVLEEDFRSPSDDLIKLLIKRIRPDLKSVTKKVRTEMSPIVKEVWAEVMDGSQGNGAPPEPPKPMPPKPSIPADVVEVPVFATYKGQRLEAILQFDKSNSSKSRIKINGELLSVGKGADKAIRTVNSSMVNGPNGWKFWKYLDSKTNSEHFITDLRLETTIRRRKQSPKVK